MTDSGHRETGDKKGHKFKPHDLINRAWKNYLDFEYVVAEIM